MSKIIILSMILNVVYPGFTGASSVIKGELPSISEEIHPKESTEDNVKKETRNNLTNKLSQSIDEVKRSCMGIKKDYDLVFGLNTGTAVVSSVGALSGAGALTAGIMKAKKDKSIEGLKGRFGECGDMSSLEGKSIDESIEDIKKSMACMKKKQDYIKELEEETKKSKMLGHVRTGLLAGATATSLTSTGLSIGSVVNIKKMAEKMSNCNKAIYNLNVVKNEVKAEIEGDDETKPELKVVTETINRSEKILSSCNKFDENIVKKLYNQSVGSAAVSGVGTVAGLGGTITSAVANSKKIRDNDTEKGKKTEKGLNLVANIYAGVVTGTSGVTAVISGVTAAMAKKESKKAGDCENTLGGI